MKKIDLIFIMASLIISLTSFLATSIIFIPIGIFMLYLLYYFVIIRKKLIKYFKKIETSHACYHFINSFIITLSVKESYEEAYQNGIRLAPEAMIEETSQIENMTIMERVNFLRSYFNLAIYKMFINVVALYQEQGGKILKMSESLIRECTVVEKSIAQSVNISKRHFSEFFVLWLLSFFILIFIRFALSQFYVQMISSPLVVGFITGFYLVFLLSLHLFLSKYISLPLKEDILDV